MKQLFIAKEEYKKQNMVFWGFAAAIAMFYLFAFAEYINDNPARALDNVKSGTLILVFFIFTVYYAKKQQDEEPRAIPHSILLDDKNLTIIYKDKYRIKVKYTDIKEVSIDLLPPVGRYNCYTITIDAKTCMKIIPTVSTEIIDELCAFLLTQNVPIKDNIKSLRPVIGE